MFFEVYSHVCLFLLSAMFSVWVWGVLVECQGWTIVRSQETHASIQFSVKLLIVNTEVREN